MHRRRNAIEDEIGDKLLEKEMRRSKGRGGNIGRKTTYVRR